MFTGLGDWAAGLGGDGNLGVQGSDVDLDAVAVG